MGASACLSGMSALAYWRETRRRIARDNAMDADDPAYKPLLVRLLSDEHCELNLDAMPRRQNASSLPASIDLASVRKAVSVLPPSDAEPLELLVNRAQGRRYFGGTRVRVFSLELPEGSICHIDSGLAAPSPEMTLLLLASQVGVFSLAQLVCEFCGLYSLEGAGFFNVPPLTSLRAVESFAEEVTALATAAGRRAPNGLGALREALDESVERGASPAETACALLLSISRRRGGYGLPKPEMNLDVKADGGSCVCDLVWPGERVALEYQSGIHERVARQSADRAKLNALQAAGFTVLQAGKEDLKQLRRADELATILCQALGVTPLRPSESFRRRQIDLRKVLLAGWWGEGV
ncbi:MAG: hypothetical protein EGQ66_03215 [Coriobacteriaceae bacterium]|nr:hypothetical protein [Coriobacteriaceae bacterium]